MQQSVVEQEFDALAGEYESNRLSRWYKAHSQELADLGPELRVGDILDVGCGTGYLLRQLSPKYPRAKLVGVDTSSEMIAQANRKIIAARYDDFCFVHDDWERLSTRSLEILGRFDFRLIVCANTFHYFKDVRNASKAMYNMLSEDGILLVLEREKLASPLTSLWGLLHRHVIKDQVEFYDTRELSDILTGAGFEDVSVVKTIKKYFWRGKVFTSIAIVKGRKRMGAE